MKRYGVCHEKIWREHVGVFFTYGLDVMDERGNLIRRIGDISTDRETVVRLARLCNALQPSAVHVDDIVNDFLATL